MAEILADLPVTAIAEFLGAKHVMAPDIRRVAPAPRVVGPAVTCHCPAGDNMPLHAALAAAAPGSVIVVASDRRTGTGLWGELATRSARARGVIGAIADGGVRDVATIADLSFPVWSRFVSPLGARKVVAEGLVNVDVSCGGVVVRPGDYVVGDDDGIVVVPVERAYDAAQSASARVALERAVHDDLANGALPLEALARHQKSAR